MQSLTRSHSLSFPWDFLDGSIWVFFMALGYCCYPSLLHQGRHFLALPQLCCPHIRTWQSF